MLIGRRGRDEVPVEGMSDGTRDQLYLALRIAALEQHFRANGPMPVVADDLLIKFDDRRAAAALRVLAELSHSTQVMVFIAGTLKSLYDLGLWVLFRNVPLQANRPPT